MTEKPKTSYLAISRKAFNHAMDRSPGVFDRPLNAPRSDQDYFLIPVTDLKGWDAHPLLKELANAVEQRGIPIGNFITISIPPIQHKPNFLEALNLTRPELVACQRCGDVRVINDMDDLIATFREIQREEKQHIKPRRNGEKIMDLETLAREIEQLRSQGGNPVIGFTSGAYDILHPGHVHFLEQAREKCDYLVVAIASDRTIRGQKGATRPYVDEVRRAQTIAAISSSGAVVISDEPYHETILKRIKPTVLFKGDDYKGKQIIGADHVKRVELIPCDAKEFNSTSTIARTVVEREIDLGQQRGNDIY